MPAAARPAASVPSQQRCMRTMSEAATTTHAPHPPHPRRVLRSVGAVLAGLLANVVLATAIDAALYGTGIYPPRFQPMADHLWALALAYRVVFAVVGGFTTARLAPARPMRHVMVLVRLGAVLRVLAVLFTWNKGPEFGPRWFSIGATITSVPFTALGGMLGAQQIGRAHV